MEYLELTLTVPSDAGEAVAGFLHRSGCGGIVEEGGDDGPTVRLQAYFPVDRRLEGRLRELREAVSNLPSRPPWHEETRVVREEDWANNWKQYYRPFRAGRRLVVVPSWEDYDVGRDDAVIRLDPGMAFGTGTHPSTFLALLALEEHLVPGDRVADIGTGSGILAIAAGRLGAAAVTAVDIDPVAVKSARGNLAHNGLEGRVAVINAGPESLPAGSADVVAANIVADVLVDIGCELVRVLRPGGTLILSGIISREEPRVAAAFTDLGLSRAGVLDREGWVALVFRADPRAPGRPGRSESGKQ